MNIPYVKQYDKHGIVTNPIEGKYVNKFPSRSQTRQKDGRRFGNKKGIQLVVTNIGRGKFTKYRKTLQKIGNKTIVHYTEVRAKA